ncbi:TetR/AcrR family transcriptional regulator [Cellulomonas soli]|uniref:HTH tetR-type domain-containing protein n=1 Tax=Cellulomonas soli TaxID=931535 RepID=A0A512PBJ8_9CELL|nr:TetR/AcrR family transcriptional regulator [Cellulomonas soli]NYI61026.1 AcrR family transcriptional regulator [Cellulomonas soli]GEP68558.1 hypothetical protein CSO01_12730 [Cellulomonas soli]
MEPRTAPAATTPARAGGRARRTVLPPEVRRDAIVDAAHAVFAEKGIARTTTSDIARAAGVTRGLVYHYFPETEQIVDAVLDRYVAGFAASVREWDARRQTGRIEDALRDIMVLFRNHLAARDPLRVDLLSVDNAALYRRYVDRAVEAVVDALQVTTVEAYARRHRIEIVHVRETFVVLVHGLLGLVRTHPDTPEHVLAAITRQTLHLDAGPEPLPAPQTEPASDEAPTGDREHGRPTPKE